MADGAYRGNPEVIIPYRTPTDGPPLPQWKEDLNTVHRSVHARVEHTLAHMKVGRSCATTAAPPNTLTETASGVAHLYNIVTTT